MATHNEADVKIGLPTIWAIGVGSALGGDFFGWEFILYGGFMSALMAVGTLTSLWCLVEVVFVAATV